MRFLSRRAFIKAGIFGGLSASAAAASVNDVNTEDLEVCRLAISSKALPAEFKGFKICFLSDIHCGVLLSEALLNKAINSIEEEKPDVLLLGGDYIGIPDSVPGLTFNYLSGRANIDGRDADQIVSIHARLGRALSAVNPPFGKWAVLGNHDHWNNGELCTQTLSKYSINFLVNQSTKFVREGKIIEIFGTDDYWTGIPRLTQEFISSGDSSFRILLSHNPDFISECLERHGNCFDLGLAGHTHGGQVVIKGIGALAGYRIRDERFKAGMVETGDSFVYTTRGLGVVDLPLRINAAPEICFFTLTQGQSQILADKI